MRKLFAVLATAVVLATPAPRSAATTPAATQAEPAAAPGGFSAHMMLSIAAKGAKGQMALHGTAACERRGGIFRLDLQSLSLDGGNGGPSIPNLTPPGGYSITYDTASMVYAIWSPSKHTYYTGKGKPPLKNPAATPTPEPSATPGNNVGSFLAKLKDLRQFSVSLALSPDKTPINGHPTTNFDFKLVRQVLGDDPVNVTGKASFADDLGGIPLLFLIDAASGPGGTQTANVRAALSEVSQNTPPASDFAPPAGYKKVDNPLDVISLPGMSP